VTQSGFSENVHARASVSVSTGPGGPDDLPLARWVDRVYIVELKLKLVCLRAALADDTLAKIRPHTLQFDLEHVHDRDHHTGTGVDGAGARKVAPGEVFERGFDEQ
jgi:hypothetical protein